MNSNILQGPFPSRKASQVLYERVMAFLSGGGVSPGDAFFSDAHVVNVSGLSRPTVRRAFDRLAREGWIERRAGVGSFVSPHARMMSRMAVARPTGHAMASRPMVRVAVLLHQLRDNGRPDWYSRGVLEGLDQAAMDAGIQIELIGNNTSDILAFSKRLAQSRPDVLVVMPAESRHIMQVGEALSLEIPCLLAGSQMLDTGLPTVTDDGVQGMALAVRHLASQGHRRIGLLLCKAPAAWPYARQEGFIEGLRACGLEGGERMVLWTPFAPPGDMGTVVQPPLYTDLLQEYMHRVQPTALILGCSGQHSRTLGEAMKAGWLQVPNDVSLVCFDQNSEDYYRYLGMRPTVVALPLLETGKRLAAMARCIFEKQPVSRAVEFLPCRLEEGESVTPPSGANRTPIPVLALAAWPERTKSDGKTNGVGITSEMPI